MPASEEIASILSAADAHLDSDLQAALAAYEDAAAIARQMKRSDLLGAALSGQGVVHKRRNDYYQAITLYSQALALCRDSEDRSCEAEVLHNLGTCYTGLGELQAARDALEDALAIWTSPYGKSATLIAIATIHDLQGEHEEAIELLHQALRLRLADRDLDAATRQRGRAAVYDRLATAYKAQGRMGESRRAYESTLAIWQSLESTSDVALTHNNLGWLYVDWHKPATALQYFDQALPRLRQLERRHGTAHALIGKAQAHRQLGDLETATSTSEEAIGILESLRSNSPSLPVKTSFLASRQPFFELYVEVLMQRHDAEPGFGFDARALQAAERFKARSLLDLLHEERDALLQGADEKLLELEDSLHQEMNATDRRRLELLAGKAALEEIVQVEKRQRGLLQRYESLKARMRATIVDSPPADPITLRQMYDLLDDDTLLLVYALGEKRSFLWTLTRQGLGSFTLPDRRTIESEAQRSYDWLRTSDQRAGRSNGPEAVARLSEILLGPVAEDLDGRRLVVVPDGWLHYVPFGALGTADIRPLLLDHEIVTLPSVSVLSALRERALERRPAPAELAVVADPVFAWKDPRADAAASPPQQNTASIPAPERLPYAAREAEAILALAPPRQRYAALGFDASRHAVLGGDLERYRIVHFAVHGEVDDEQPMNSHLVLSLLDPEGRSRDGRLYLHEIDDLALSADLVVLSACNTALGKNVRGEGLVGMTRGFMYAGATSVVVSLWYVNDEATAKLMEKFYRELLLSDLTPAEALRAAQVWMQRSLRWQSPYFWAGFVLQGDWR